MCTGSRVRLSWTLLLALVLAFPGLAVASRSQSPASAYVSTTTAGKVVAWNVLGQIDVPAEAQSGVTSIAAGNGHMLALKEGKVIAWGGNNNGQPYVPTEAMSGVTAVAAGGGHSLALRDGKVIGWGGGNLFGERNVPVSAQSGVTAIAGGSWHSLAVKDGGVITWGQADYGLAAVPSEAQSGVTAVAGGTFFSMALTSTGKVVAWGDNSGGKTDVPIEAQSGVTAIAAGNRNGLALKAGKVIAWGSNGNAQERVPAEAQSGVTAIAASLWYYMAVKDARIIVWDNDGNPCAVPSGLAGVTAVAAGYNFNMALLGVEDTTPPTTTVVAKPLPAPSSGWNRSAVTLTFSATDNADGTGVAKTECSLDGSAWYDCSQGTTVTSEGYHSVRFRSVDWTGNVEEFKTIDLKIDRTPPIAEIETLSTYTDTDTLHWSYSDALSGVSGSLATLDGENVPLQPGQTSFSLLGLQPGQHTFRVLVTDLAANRTWATLTFTLEANLSSLPRTVDALVTASQVVDKGGLSSVYSKLQEARTAYEKGQTNVARNKLQDLLQQVRAQSGKLFSELGATLLSADIQWVLDHL